MDDNNKKPPEALSLERELATREQAIRQAECELQEKQEKLEQLDKEIDSKKGRMRDHLYSRINVSLKTMDQIVFVVGGLLLFFLLYGIFGAK